VENLTMPLRWLRLLRRHSLAHVRVVVYTRERCPLCDEAIEFLTREKEQLGFHLTLVDVDSSEALREQHGDCVPVVEVDGKVRFRGHVNPVLWRRMITALTSRAG
jgi:glutaredoxin